MTRKDYIKIAKTISDSTKTVSYSELESQQNGQQYFVLDWFNFTNSLADILQADNPNFNKGRFIDACSQNKPTQLGGV
tara:strand:- start:308 stop:541 length:234 start_codon:yes stop_codon:yes gene_type:complete